LLDDLERPFGLTLPQKRFDGLYERFGQADADGAHG